MSLQVLKRKPAVWLVAVGIVVLGITGWLWWAKVQTNAERVFWGTLNQGLQTSGVTVQSSQKNTNSTVAQTVQYSFGPQATTHSLTTLTQGKTVVRDEMIGTPTTDYTRYLSISTDQKKANGQALDFSKVLGVWAKNSAGAQSGSQQNQLFPQAVLGTGLPLGGVAMPLADLPPTQRASLVKQIRDDNLYQINFAKVTKTHQNGRLVYVYEATISPVAYARMMKSFAASTGLHDLEQLDPNNFSGQPNFTMRLTVDVYARQLLQAEAVSAAVRQTYDAYGVPVQVTIPTKTITVTELQQRLRTLQQ